MEKRKKKARPAHTYRGARRNAARAAGTLRDWKRSQAPKHRPYMSTSKTYRGPVRSPWQRKLRATMLKLQKKSQAVRSAVRRVQRAFDNRPRNAA